MTKHYNANPPYVEADANLVLCDGTSMTGPGGRISSKDTAYLDTLQEMTAEEAEALIEANDPEAEATEEDYQAALAELGVQLNEEE